jgi:hypothetical protein
MHVHQTTSKGTELLRSSLASSCSSVGIHMQGFLRLIAAHVRGFRTHDLAVSAADRSRIVHVALTLCRLISESLINGVSWQSTMPRISHAACAIDAVHLDLIIGQSWLWSMRCREESRQGMCNAARSSLRASNAMHVTLCVVRDDPFRTPKKYYLF